MKHPRYSQEECKQMIDEVAQRVNNPFGSLPDEIWKPISQKLKRSATGVMNKFYSMRKQTKWSNIILKRMKDTTEEASQGRTIIPEAAPVVVEEKSNPEAHIIRIFQIKVVFSNLELVFPVVATDMGHAADVAQLIAEEYNGEALSVSYIDEVSTDKDRILTYYVNIKAKE